MKKYQIEFLIQKDDAFHWEQFVFEVADDVKPWSVIKAKQKQLFADGATGANPCHFQHLTRDVYVAPFRVPHKNKRSTNQ